MNEDSGIAHQSAEEEAAPLKLAIFMSTVTLSGSGITVANLLSIRWDGDADAQHQHTGLVRAPRWRRGQGVCVLGFFL